MKKSAILLSLCLAACAAEGPDLEAEQETSEQAPEVAVSEAALVSRGTYLFAADKTKPSVQTRLGELAVSVVCMRDTSGVPLGGIVITNGGGEANYRVNIRGSLGVSSNTANTTRSTDWKSQWLTADSKPRRFMVQGVKGETCEKFIASVAVDYVEPIR